MYKIDKSVSGAVKLIKELHIHNIICIYVFQKSKARSSVVLVTSILLYLCGFFYGRMALV